MLTLFWEQFDDKKEFSDNPPKKSPTLSLSQRGALVFSHNHWDQQGAMTNNVSEYKRPMMPKLKGFSRAKYAH